MAHSSSPEGASEVSTRSDPINFNNPFSDNDEFADIPDIPPRLASWLSGHTDNISSPLTENRNATVHPPPLSAPPRLQLNIPSTNKPKPKEIPQAKQAVSPESNDPYATKLARSTSSYSSYTDSNSSRRRSSGNSDPVIRALTEQIEDLRYDIRLKEPESFDGRYRVNFRAEDLSEHSETSLEQARLEYRELERRFAESQKATDFFRELAQRYLHQRDRARVELTYANSALEQSCGVVDELGRLLEGTRELAQTVAPKLRADARPKEPKSKGAWVRGSWLAGRRPALAEAERLFAAGDNATALKRADGILLSPAATSADILEAKLLRAAVLRDAGDIARALAAAESTVALAHELGHADVEAAAQFQRARALMPLQRWAEASWLLLLASETAELREECEANREFAESRRLMWSPRDPRRYLPKNFSATAPQPLKGL